MGNRATMTPEELQSLLRRRPELLARPEDLKALGRRPDASLCPPEPSPAIQTPGKAIKGVNPKKRTRPEVEMGMILEKQVAAGEVLRFDFEAITLLIGDPPTRFTPDFFVELPSGRVRFVEVKGPFIREDSVIKFKCAKKQYPCFEFELWQRSKSGEWTRLV